MRFFAIGGLAALLFATSSAASPISFCAEGNEDVCFQVAVPSSSVSSGSGDIYFQITAPDSLSWVGLGTGTRMSDANMFLLYEDGSGGVTISARQASGHSMPEAVSSRSGGADLELLSGSNVSSGVMTANVRCSNCESWSDGESMDLGSSATSWIAAWRTGDAVDSSSVEAEIEAHNGPPERFSIDLTRATVDGSGNPFTGGDERPSTGSDDDAVDGQEPDGGDQDMILAHGIVMTVVFVGLYPLGAILMPLLGKWFIHAGWQVLAFVIMWAGFGLGVVYAERNDHLFNNPHTVIGLLAVILMGAQPFLGYAHHVHYKNHGSRGIVSHSHIWVGRAAMVLGILTGGFGLRMTEASDAWIIAYAVVAAVMSVLYAAVAGFTHWRRRRGAKAAAGSRSPEREESSDSRVAKQDGA